MTDRPARLAWLPIDVGVALSCLPAVAAALAAGILLGSPRSGAVALPRVTAHPSSRWVAAGLTATFALLAFVLQQGNRLGRRTISYPGSYAVFAACLTAYVVYLLHYGGLDEREVAVVRVLLTALGGVCAVARGAAPAAAER